VFSDVKILKFYCWFKGHIKILEVFLMILFKFSLIWEGNLQLIEEYTDS